MSLDADIDRLLAESQDSTRYRDCAIVARRLTLSHNVPVGAVLTDNTGRRWIADDIADDGLQPVHGEVLWSSGSAENGLVLRYDGGEVRLCVEVIVYAGGVWDSQKRCYRLGPDGKRLPAAKPVIVDLVPDQVAICRWFEERLAAFRERRPHPQMVCELYADRRAGKTFLGILFVLMTVYECPTVDGQPLVAWLVSRQHNTRDELDQTIAALLPPDAYIFRELPKRRYLFHNGATCLHKTVDDPEGSLKAGRCDIALLNEASTYKFDAFRHVLRACQDKNGLVCIATNRPGKGAFRGNWVTQLADGAARAERAGKVPPVKVFRLDPDRNVAISRSAKRGIDETLRYVVDEDESLDEGEILEAGDKLLSPPFDDAVHVRPLPLFGFVDVTQEVTQKLFGRAFKYVAGADWQQQSATAVFKVFAPSLRELDKWVMVCTHAWFLRSGGDEYDVIACVENAGLTPADVLTIGDCSGHFQNYNHSYGPVSFAIYQRLGWTITGPTEKRTEKGLYPKNPPVEQSVGRLRTLISEGRFLIAAGDTAAPMAVAARKCEARRDSYGNLRAKSIHAHLCDCARYICHWLSAKPHLLKSDFTAPPVAVSGRARGR